MMPFDFGDFPEKGSMTMDLFEESLKDMVERYGSENQDGIKYALNDAQMHFGCVDVHCQELIALAFGVDVKFVKMLMKFMPTIKERVIPCQITCCSGPRCAKNGSVEVFKALRETLNIDFNETTADGQIRLSTYHCFKRCGDGPNIQVNGEFYHRMNREKAIALAKSLKEQYRRL